MFGKPTQFCLDPKQCFCNTYGYCDMSDVDLQQQWQWRGQSLPDGWPNVPDAPTQAHLTGEPEAEAESESEAEPKPETNDSAEQSLKQTSEQPPAQRKRDDSKISSRKRSLALADEMLDISDASRQALRDASV
jgi:hypothetical protein